MAFKSNLQAVRKRAGFKSARDFAEHMGISPHTYTKYEQGSAMMSLVQAWEFADALDCTLDELAGRRVPEQPSITQDEQRVLDGYRIGDKSTRRTMMHAADDAFADMEETAKNKEKSA